MNLLQVVVGVETMGMYEEEGRPWIFLMGKKLLKKQATRIGEAILLYKEKIWRS